MIDLDLELSPHVIVMQSILEKNFQGDQDEPNQNGVHEANGVLSGSKKTGESNSMPDYLNLEEGGNVPILVSKSLPKVHSNPEISPHIRPGLEASLVQHAVFDEYFYNVDLSRNVASKSKIQCDTNEEKDKLNLNSSLMLLGAPNESCIYRSMSVSATGNEQFQ